MFYNRNTSNDVRFDCHLNCKEIFLDHMIYYVQIIFSYYRKKYQILYFNKMIQRDLKQDSRK